MKRRHPTISAAVRLQIEKELIDRTEIQFVEDGMALCFGQEDEDEVVLLTWQEIGEMFAEIGAEVRFRKPK